MLGNLENGRLLAKDLTVYSLRGTLELWCAVRSRGSPTYVEQEFMYCYLRVGFLFAAEVCASRRRTTVCM